VGQYIVVLNHQKRETGKCDFIRPSLSLPSARVLCRHFFLGLRIIEISVPTSKFVFCFNFFFSSTFDANRNEAGTGRMVTKLLTEKILKSES
jgi:hypothetical protein